MTLRGRIKNGGVVLDQPAPLPDGTEVLVHAVEEPASKPAPAGGPSIWDKLLELEGTVELPPDAAGKLRRCFDGADEREA
jgi:hypothetical protein